MRKTIVDKMKGIHMTNNTGRFKLITNDSFKKSLKTSCTVKIGNEVDVFNHFVVIGENESDGSITFIKNADIITLGMAMETIRDAFYTAYDELPAYEKEEVRELLGR